MIVLLGVLVVMAYAPLIQAAIPPTNAFFQLFVGSENITATSYRDSFEFSGNGSIALDIVGDNVTFAISPPSPTILGGVHSGNCAVNSTVTGITTNGDIVCTALP